MNWKIKYSSKAQYDLDIIYEYIAIALLEPDVAKNLVKLIIKEIRSLSFMPERHRLYNEEPWKSRGLRFFSVKKYLIFYLPVEADKTVYIVRIMYSGRDISNQLNRII